MEQTLSSYYIFYVVADCGNISKAAAKLYISQPAVSKSIQKLEGSLGCRLFLRGSRGVVLTEEGSVLYAHVKSAIDTLSRGEEKIRRSIDLGTGHLKIGASSTLCKYVLLPYLKDFIKEHPHMNISIKCQSTSKTLQLIQEDKLDIGLIGLGNQELMHMLQFDYILDIEDLFVATKQYLYHLQLRGVSEHEILQNCSLMLLEKNNITRQYIDEYLQKNKIVIRECIDASSMDLLIEFAKIHLGVACVIRQFVEPELADGSLIEIPLPAPIHKRSIGFVYKPQRKTTLTMEKFLSFIQK
ncbi:MAG: LysR family transcriptional regulator [Eubacterium sp.]|nr:LysR family transcriptional regulator [Eubacterium sp.]MCI8918152.1 LysR family transcriptional regulator [Eubacterium sp.]